MSTDLSLQLPRISIATPSWNQGRFIAQNFGSVVSQNYPDVEQIVVDAESTDETHEVIRRFESHLAKVVIGKDNGQYDAINKGLALSTGEVMGWLNADDLYLPGALRVVGTIFAKFPDIEWVTTRVPAIIDEQGALIKANPVYGFTKEGFLHGDNLAGAGWQALTFIQQESTFWRRSLWERAGARVDDSLSYAADFELWARFFQHAPLYSVDVPIACFRRHETQKSFVAFDRYLEEARGVFERVGGRVRSPHWQRIRLTLRTVLPARVQDWMERKKFLSATPHVTYDWNEKHWRLGR